MSGNESKRPPNETDATSVTSAGEVQPKTTSIPPSLSADPTTSSAFRANPSSSHQQHQPPPPPPPHPPHPHPHHPPHVPLYHHGGGYVGYVGGGGPYSAAMAKTGSSVTSQPYHVHRPPPPPSYDREDPQHYHRPLPVRAPPASAYPPAHYVAEDRRWIGPDGAPAAHPSHPYPPYDYPHPPPPIPPPPPPVAQSAAAPPPGHVPGWGYYAAGQQAEAEKSRGPQQQQQPALPSSTASTATHSESFNDVDGREGATSPSQIEMSHRDEVVSMGCTCKKTKCLKLYCQCFAVKVYCGPNCRCLVCFNTTKHETARKDAMRAILTRNPGAFDAKFSKTTERKTKEQQAVLAHKLGCKCRKSACMKKYCECYAGNVKCSPNCRCIGCKNTPNNNSFGPGKPDSNLPIREGGMVGYDPRVHNGGGRREPWMMNAAQNLAFLKHGSPTVERTTVHMQPDAGEVASMPSLAASSSDTSPEEKPEDASARPPEKKEGEPAVNSLLMAAMAMTEFQARKDAKAGLQNGEAGATTVEEPVASQQDRPEVRKVFRPSPKRKSSDRAEEEATIIAGTGSQEAADVTANGGNSNNHCSATGPATKPSSPTLPLDPRDLKRTRLGSVRKKMSWEKGEGEEAGDSPDNLPKEQAPQLETPNQKTSGPDILTPVSARCIDFKNIHLSSASPVSSINEKKDGS